MREKPGFGRIGLAVIGIGGFVYLVGPDTKPNAPSAQHVQPVETYRLVHAIGNDEQIVEQGLEKRDCEDRKRDRKVIAEALGTYNERLGYGSITCLPESVFAE